VFGKFFRNRDVRKLAAIEVESPQRNKIFFHKQLGEDLERKACLPSRMPVPRQAGAMKYL